MSYIRILLLSLFLLIIPATESLAQRITPLDIKKEREKKEREEYEEKILSEYEYTDEDLELLQIFYRNCQSDGSSTYYDCRCIAMGKLNKFIVYDDTKSDYKVFQEISPSCVDKASVAGYVYTGCISMSKIDPRWSDEFCSCYGREYAEMFAKHEGQFRVGQSTRLRVQAMGNCGMDRILRQNLPKMQAERRARNSYLSNEARKRGERE